MSNLQLDALEGLVCSATRELLEPLEIAILLGAKISAPAGAQFFQIQRIDAENEQEYTFGAWSTYEAAEIALAQYIIDQCDSYLGQYPWEENDPQDKAESIVKATNPWAEYFKYYSIQDLITTFQDYIINDTFKIEERFILRTPTSVLDDFTL